MSTASSEPRPAGQHVTLSVDGQPLLFPQLPYDMHKRAIPAAADAKLQKFVNAATLLKDNGRRRIMAETFGAERYEKMRQLAGSIKEHTLDYLDHYLEEFIANAEKAGAQVHFAPTGEHANNICAAIAKENACKLCVKSKSMVTEETHLLPVLEGMGVEVVETDLGEFILQLDNDAPSHIVQPMIHKDRAAVARAFQRELRAPYTESPEELTQIARTHLRLKYRQADLGISGGNFLVADSGSVVICTNEGNGRLCTSVPRVHVVFVGIEKLVPRREHLAVMLKMLARSSTSQPLTCYTHIMTGPRRPSEPDGPQQMHIILVDNGRSEILRAPTREMLRCIRCGACLNACPVYRKVGGHSYGAVYSGPIGALITPLFKGIGNFKDLPQASSLCGACYEACPVKINIPRQLVNLRQEMVQKDLTSVQDQIMYRLWAISLRFGPLYRVGAILQRIFFRKQAALVCSLERGDRGWIKHLLYVGKQVLLAGTLESNDSYADRGWIKQLPGPVAGWTQVRDMPTPPARGFRDWWREHQQELDR